jgi:hypothetical protein
MKRVRQDDDGNKTVFTPRIFDQKGSYHAEIQVSSLEELWA